MSDDAAPQSLPARPSNASSAPSSSSSAAAAANAFNYPWAAAPDIIRAHQKDAYFQSTLLTHLSSVIRALYGTRAEHRWSREASVFTELLYLSLTTLAGNRTLGEEYTDLAQVDADSGALAGAGARAGYIVSAVLAPYALSKLLPALRRRLRAKLERTLARTHHRRASSPSRAKAPPARSTHLQAYALRHLDALTSPAPLYALGLAVFYFGGAYYQLSKRVWRLRYVFTRALAAGDARAGYEVLGVLLLVQLAVQSYLHLRETYRRHHVAETAGEEGGEGGGEGEAGAAAAQNHFAAPILFDAPAQHSSADPDVVRRRVLRVTHTPAAGGGGDGSESALHARDGEQTQSEDQAYRYHLLNDEAMRWMGESAQQRKCTLCLDPLKDPAATTCGHVFCWACVTDWLREQPMCPLCRQPALVQHVLPLRG